MTVGMVGYIAILKVLLRLSLRKLKFTIIKIGNFVWVILLFRLIKPYFCWY